MQQEILAAAQNIAAGAMLGSFVAMLVSGLFYATKQGRLANIIFGVSFPAWCISAGILFTSFMH